MELKKRKMAMMTLLSLMLATSGCASKGNYQENAHEEIEEIINKSEDYENSYYQENITSLYQFYLDNFLPYMSEKQYEKFKCFMGNMNLDEFNEFDNTFKYLNDIFEVTDTSYGRGFYKTFNSRILNEELMYQGESGKKLNFYINTLCSLCNDKSELFKSIFSNDIEILIDYIMNSTGYKNREKLEELFLKMDTYYDIKNSSNPSDETLASTYEKEIREIIAELIESKKLSDATFANSLYANLLLDSYYFGGGIYEIIPSITQDEFYLDITDGDDTYRLENIPIEYLYGDYTIEEVRSFKVEEVIKRSFKLDEEDNSRVPDTMQLMISLLDKEKIDFSNCSSPKEMREMMYKNLKDYFASEDEFNIFFLKLFDYSMVNLDDFFELLEKRIQEHGINYYDYTRYLALINYANSRKSMSTYYPNGDYLSREEIASLKPEECEGVVELSESYALFSYKLNKDNFAQIENTLSSNVLGFEYIYNPDYKITWQYGTIDAISENNNQVISREVKPQTTEYNGIYITYYVCPKGFDADTSVAVETFVNPYNEFAVREIEGFKTLITDPNTGSEMMVFIADLTNHKKEYASIRFSENYSIFLEKYQKIDKNNTYTLGGNYE